MDEELKRLLEKNLALTEEIFKMTKSIKSFVIWQRVFFFVKILIIIIPIILGIIYLPPLLKNLVGQYQGLLGIDGNQINTNDLNSLSPEMINLLKK